MDANASPVWIQRQAQLTLDRILPRLCESFARVDRAEWATYERRLRQNFERLFAVLHHLYGGRYDFFYHLEQILETTARLAFARPADLKALDSAREADSTWFQSQNMLGGVCYVDLFARNLAGLRTKLPYFKELGLTYLHLMPLFKAPEGENDGGYAVSSYRDVNPQLGTIAELSDLARELRGQGISLTVDFVFNHTSNEHEWARRAQAGDEEYQEFYYIFPDRSIPDAYERTLREIFPDARPGNFTYRPDMGKWVWTTFYSFQWDLNYANPAVFRAMLEEMLSLANAGVEVLRLDAVAFIWKKLGTTCENLPEAHMIIQAYNALARIAAPTLLFKSEAIVHPDEVARYISPNECQLSYNPLLMALLWESLATREVRLLQASMAERFRIRPGCAWVNYVRVHDDIGWTFDDIAAQRLGINGYDHRRFLNGFYTGKFAGSFARGLPFQENPRTGDARISGTCASLAGLEKAMREEGPEQIDLAIGRILLIHSVILSIGGIPLIYLGDEVGTVNDYRYREDPAKAADSRWVHRPFTDWEHVDKRKEPGTVEDRIFGAIARLIRLRKATRALSDSAMQVIDPGNGHVFGYVRQSDQGRVLVLCNFSEHEQHVAANTVRANGLSYDFTDLVTGEEVVLHEQLVLAPYRFVWLVAR
jgi:amylosucrase